MRRTTDRRSGELRAPGSGAGCQASAEPPWEAVERLALETGSMGLCVFARSLDADYQLAVRAWVGATGRFEDAASGAANATLAAWLAERDALPGTGGRYRISQGREVGFDARIELQVDADGEVWSGGRVQTVIAGTIDWERAHPMSGYTPHVFDYDAEDRIEIDDPDAS